MILDWPKMYKEKITNAQTALSRIRRGARIFIASACGEPQASGQNASVEMAPNFSDVEIIHFLDLGLTDYTSEIYTEHFRHNALFIGANARRADQGRACRLYPGLSVRSASAHAAGAPCPLMLRSLPFPPPDMNGYVSLGISVDITKDGGGKRRLCLWRKSNQNMPADAGRQFFCMSSQISAFVENDVPLLEFVQESPGDIARSPSDSGLPT